MTLYSKLPVPWIHFEASFLITRIVDSFWKNNSKNAHFASLPKDFSVYPAKLQSVLRVLHVLLA
jgi:hypothetical protein